MSFIYHGFKVALARRELPDNIEALDIRAALVDTDVYTPDAAHDFRSQLTGVIAESGPLANVSVSATGQIDADDIIITGVSGDPSEVVVFYIDTGNPATSRLISCIDAPLAPDGGNVQLQISGIVNL